VDSHVESLINEVCTRLKKQTENDLILDLDISKTVTDVIVETLEDIDYCFEIIKRYRAWYWGPDRFSEPVIDIYDLAVRTLEEELWEGDNHFREKIDQIVIDSF